MNPTDKEKLREAIDSTIRESLLIAHEHYHKRLFDTQYEHTRLLGLKISMEESKFLEGLLILNRNKSKELEDKIKMIEVVLQTYK